MKHSEKHWLVTIMFLAGCASGSVPAPDDPPLRSLHVAQEAALAAITTEFSITERRDGRVEGRFWATSGAVNRGSIERSYGCVAARATTDDKTWVCTPSGRRIEWPRVLFELDRAGVMAPPSDSTSRNLICADGAPWRVVVWRSLQRDSIVTTQSCGPIRADRRVFEQRIDSIIASVARQAQRQP